MSKLKLFATKNDIPAESRSQIVAILNSHLADISDLHSQLKQAHWNVKGPHFFSLHELFDKLAAELFPTIDEVAERVTALGGYALGTLRQGAANSRLPEFPESANSGAAVLDLLIDRYAIILRSSRSAIDVTAQAGDACTADLFTEITSLLDKQLWFLEAHRQES